MYGLSRVWYVCGVPCSLSNILRSTIFYGSKYDEEQPQLTFLLVDVLNFGSWRASLGTLVENGRMPHPLLRAWWATHRGMVRLCSTKIRSLERFVDFSRIPFAFRSSPFPRREKLQDTNLVRTRSLLHGPGRGMGEASRALFLQRRAARSLY